MKDKKIIFIGCVEFSNFFLKELLNKKVNIVGVCTKKNLNLIQIFQISHC